MGKIGERDIDALGPKQREDGTRTDAYLWDGELSGFGVKATPGGKRVFIVQYRIGGRAGKTQRVTIGPHGHVTLTEARKRAKELLGKVAANQDPAGERRAIKQTIKEKRDAGTLQEAIERFLTLHEHPTRYWKEKRARLLGADLAALHGVPIRDVTRGRLKSAIDAVKARSHAAARLLFADLRPFFKWLAESELIETNPMTGVHGPKPLAARDRVLEDHEVKAFWQAANEMSWPFASIYQLLLLTGARREEVAGMTWSELDLEAGLWTLPASRTKNKREHRIPLTEAALALLGKQAATGGEFVFSTTGTTPPSGWSKAKRALDSRMKERLGTRFKPWRLHDLRRTCATGMENLGVPTHVVETALNHVSGAKAGIVGVYQRAEHREAVKAAFEKWAQRVMEIVGDEGGPSNVVPIWRAG